MSHFKSGHFFYFKEIRGFIARPVLYLEFTYCRLCTKGFAFPWSTFHIVSKFMPTLSLIFIVRWPADDEIGGFYSIVFHMHEIDLVSCSLMQGPLLKLWDVCYNNGFFPYVVSRLSSPRSGNPKIELMLTHISQYSHDLNTFITIHWDGCPILPNWAVCILIT